MSTQVPRPKFPELPKYGSLELKTRYLISPLAKYTNVSFRRVVRRCGGVGLATTDLVNSRALMAKTRRSLELIESHAEDRPYSVQIFGNDSQIMRDAAQFLEDYGADSIDINMGCPVDRVANNGSGAGMMCRTDETIGLVQQVVDAVQIPVSVKMRLGWDDTQITAPAFARAFEQIGVVAIAIHGRTREQGFSGTVNLDGIRQVVEAVETIPVIGNGDVRTVADAARMLKVTGCDGVSVGRGALANPWIFRQLQQWEETGHYDPPGTFEDRLELLKQQLDHLTELLGERRAIVSFRRTVHWYLKSMRVRVALRHQLQMAETRAEFDETLAEINTVGPLEGTRDGVLPELQIAVPTGPNERW